VPVSTDTQRNLVAHRLPKSPTHLAPQWPWRLAAETSLTLATLLASSPPSTCRQHRFLYQLKNPSTASKRLILYTSTLPPRCGFVTHRHAHMCACSLHRGAYVRNCSLHRCTSMRTCLFHKRAPRHTCSPYRCAQLRACSTYRRTLVRSYSPHRCALRECLKSPLPCPHVHISGRQVRTYALLLPNRPRIWGPHLLITPVRPSVQPLPKN
jgi:hypothetical protein